MLGILVVAPVVGWALLEEANARFTITGTDLIYQTVGGIKLIYPWNEIAGFKTKSRPSRLARFFLGDDDPGTDSAPVTDEDDDTEEEPKTLLLTTHSDYTNQIAGPLMRFLHRLAHGTDVPIYGGLDNREQLLDEINLRVKSGERTPGLDEQTITGPDKGLLGEETTN
jgi:hypothetical protein